jgi:uncharacterized protein (DUF983 family)
MTEHWTPERRPLVASILRGLGRRCPKCGRRGLFAGYLAIRDCPHCQAPTGAIRADDFPPYATIMVVGHIVIPLLLVVEQIYAPALWLHLALWPAATLALTLWLLPPIKGGILGLMWALRLKGDEH